MAWRLFIRGAIFCLAAWTSANLSRPVHAQDASSPAPVDGWGGYVFGMTRGQAEEVLQRTGRSHIIEGTVWNVENLAFVNDSKKYEDTGKDGNSGNLYEIYLRTDSRSIRPCYPARLVNALASRYGTFQVYPGFVQDLPGRRLQAQPYAVKQIGRVTITLDIELIWRLHDGTLECGDPTITYFKAGLAHVPASKLLPQGRF